MVYIYASDNENFNEAVAECIREFKVLHPDKNIKDAWASKQGLIRFLYPKQKKGEPVPETPTTIHYNDFDLVVKIKNGVEPSQIFFFTEAQNGNDSSSACDEVR